MLKAFNLRCVIRDQCSVVLTRCSYSSNNGGKRKDGGKNDTPIEPLQLSYNSYEDLSSDPTTPPVIIMHGKH